MTVLSRLRERKGPIAERNGEVRVSHAMRVGAKLEAAERLRRNETRAEKRLWGQLRNRQLKNFKFVRQAPLGPYIVDFLCREQNLIVEVDGATHSKETEISGDLRRASHLQALGYGIIRLQNDEVINGMDEVLTLILEALET